MLKYDPIARVEVLLQKLNLQLPTVVSNKNHKKAIIFMHRQTFLGQPQTFGNKTASGKLNSKQIEDLSSIGIKEEEGKHYHKGLVTVSLKKNKIELIKIHSFLHYQLLQIRNFPSKEISEAATSLLHGISLCSRAEIALIEKHDFLLNLLQEEHLIQLAQLGSLMLSANFITQLKEPVHFIDTTAVRLGRLTELLLIENYDN